MVAVKNVNPIKEEVDGGQEMLIKHSCTILRTGTIKATQQQQL